MLQINLFFSDTFKSVLGGTAAVLSLGTHELYNVCMTLFDVGVETTTVLTMFHTLRYRHDWFYYTSTECAIPDDSLRYKSL
jgi:hypothetical protein